MHTRWGNGDPDNSAVDNSWACVDNACAYRNHVRLFSAPMGHLARFRGRGETSQQPGVAPLSYGFSDVHLASRSSEAAHGAAAAAELDRSRRRSSGPGNLVHPGKAGCEKGFADTRRMKGAVDHSRLMKSERRSINRNEGNEGISGELRVHHSSIRPSFPLLPPRQQKD